MQTQPTPTALQLVLEWLDWRVLSILAVLLLSLLFPRVRGALAGTIAAARALFVRTPPPTTPGT